MGVYRKKFISVKLIPKGDHCEVILVLLKQMQCMSPNILATPLVEWIWQYMMSIQWWFSPPLRRPMKIFKRRLDGIYIPDYFLLFLSMNLIWIFFSVEKHLFFKYKSLSRTLECCLIYTYLSYTEYLYWIRIYRPASASICVVEVHGPKFVTFPLLQQAKKER